MCIWSKVSLQVKQISTKCISIRLHNIRYLQQEYRPVFHMNTEIHYAKSSGELNMNFKLYLFFNQPIILWKLPEKMRFRQKQEHAFDFL